MTVISAKTNREARASFRLRPRARAGDNPKEGEPLKLRFFERRAGFSILSMLPGSAAAGYSWSRVFLVLLFGIALAPARLQADGNIFRQDSGWAHGHGNSYDSGPRGTSFTQKPPAFTAAPKLGLSSVSVAPLQSILADPPGRNFAFAFGVEFAYHDDSGLRVAIAGMRQSFGSSSTDLTSAFTGNYSITSYLVSALMGYDVFTISNKSVAAGAGPGWLITIGPLAEAGLAFGTQIQGANAYGENIQSASTSVPFGSLAISMDVWRRGVPLGGSLRLGYRYFPSLVFPGGVTKVSLSAPYLDFVIPISL